MRVFCGVFAGWGSVVALTLRWFSRSWGVVGVVRKWRFSRDWEVVDITGWIGDNGGARR